MSSISSFIAVFLSDLPNTAVPATAIFAPALYTEAMFEAFTPPSTWILVLSPLLDIRFFARAIFSVEDGI